MSAKQNNQPSKNETVSETETIQKNETENPEQHDDPVGDTDNNETNNEKIESKKETENESSTQSAGNTDGDVTSKAAPETEAPDTDGDKPAAPIIEAEATDLKEDNNEDKSEDDVEKEGSTDDKPPLAEEDLEEEWKKLTEDPNYPSLNTVDNLTSRTTTQNPMTSELPPQTDATSVPNLNLQESSRLTQLPTFTSRRTFTDTALSTPFHKTTPDNNQNYIHRYHSRRRRSFPRSQISFNEPYQHKEDFLDENMSISATKLDGLLLRLFSKPKYTEDSTFSQNSSYTKRDYEKIEVKNTSLAFFENGGSDIFTMDPVVWQIQPMTSTQKETLQSELSFLEENLEPKEITKRLFMDGIITHLDYNQLTHTEGQGDRAVVRLLVGTLQRRGAKAYPAFIRGLKDLDHLRISGKLEATELEISQGLDEDRDDLERRTKMDNLTRLDNRTPLTPNQDRTSEPVNNKADANIATPTNQNQGQESNREEYNKKVQQQLVELNAELKALHEDITTLQTARSNNGSDPTRPENVPATNQKSSSCTIL